MNVLEVDCWNHLCNVLLRAMIKHLDKFLAVKLKDDLEQIESRLRVSTQMEAVLRALEKEFGLCANYPKGHGDDFCTGCITNTQTRFFQP